MLFNRQVAPNIVELCQTISRLSGAPAKRSNHFNIWNSDVAGLKDTFWNCIDGIDNRLDHPSNRSAGRLLPSRPFQLCDL